MMPLLLITATKLEAKLFHEELALKKENFALGELYRYKSNIYLAHLGIAKVNTAAGLAILIDKLKPSKVIQFGIAGAYPNSSLEITELVLASSEMHIDCGLKTDKSWQGMKELGFSLLEKDKNYYNLFPTNSKLNKEFLEFGIKAVSFATSETVTASHSDALRIEQSLAVAVESMEGAAAAQVCLALDTAFAEIRAISNVVGERDKSKWQIEKAVLKLNKKIIKYVKSV